MNLITSVNDKPAKLTTNYYQSPPGILEIIHNNQCVSAIRWSELDCLPVNENNPLFEKVSLWLDCYFSGKAPLDTVEFTLAGTDFQRRVWSQMLEISPGTTKTYGEVAAQLNSSARAVGGACRANPVIIIVPCHRIIAASGPGGYSGKTGGVMLDRKLALLECDKELVS